METTMEPGVADSEDVPLEEHRIRRIPVELIDPYPDNPRANPPAADYAELQASIAERGILQPLLMRPRPGGRYELAAGERRYRSAKALGLAAVPGIVREMDDKEICIICQLENFQRANLTPIQEAMGFAALVRHGVPMAEIAKKMGVLPRTINRRLAILQLPAKFLKVAADPGSTVSSWPAELYDELTRFGKGQVKDACEQVLKRWSATGESIPAPAGLRKYLNERLVDSLDGAEWDLDDAELFPAAGACSTCPKRAKEGAADLFDEGDVKGQACMDKDCFQKKAWCFRAKQAIALKELHPKLTIYSHQGHRDVPQPARRMMEKAGLGPNTWNVSPWGIEEVKKEEGAPAIRITKTGEHFGIDGKKLSLFYVGKKKAAGVRGSGGAGASASARPTAAESIKAKRKKLESDRSRLVASLLGESVRRPNWKESLTALKTMMKDLPDREVQALIFRAQQFRDCFEAMLSEPAGERFAALVVGVGAEDLRWERGVQGAKMKSHGNVIESYLKASSADRTKMVWLAIGFMVAEALGDDPEALPKIVSLVMGDKAKVPGSATSVLEEMAALALLAMPEPEAWTKKEKAAVEKKTAKKAPKGVKKKIAQEPAEGEAASLPPQPPKRKRGRPRKDAGQAPAQKAPKEEVPKVAKKRGRPPKAGKTGKKTK